jgi:hypothetical protein
MQGLAPAVSGIISAVLSPSGEASQACFGSKRLGTVYRTYLISQFLDAPKDMAASDDIGPGARVAGILAEYHLADAGSESWLHLYEHIAGVTAAALTIAKRMRLNAGDLEKVRAATLLHDATKRQDIERHGLLASSLENTNHSLAVSMVDAGFSADTIIATMNTGRADRQFSTASERTQSIREKGVIATITGLADARSLGASFLSLDDALQRYLARKKDPESQDFFTKHWLPYYQEAENYLRLKVPDLDLLLDSADIYRETVFPEVFGQSPSKAIRARYAYALDRGS